MENYIYFIAAIIIAGVIGRILYNPIRRWRWSKVKGLKNLNDKQFQKELEDLNGKFLLDVRELSEVQQGYIPEMVHIPVREVAQRMDEIPKDKKILIYCRGGVRSGMAGQILLNNGYKDVSHLSGGIEAWTGKINK